MRKKELKLIVTFRSTTEAMAMERVCKEQKVPGRLIPVPRSLSASCGLAWCAPPECRELLVQVMERVGVKEENMQECVI